MPKILHTADLHLGSPFGGLPENISRTLRNESFDVLKRLCELARGTDALVISGDLFDSPSVPKSVAERAAAILGTAVVPVFISPGNHDFLHRRSPYRLTEFPGNVHIFSADSIQRVELDGFDVYGAAFDSDKSGPLLTGFRAERDKPSVMALHCELSPSVPKYNPVSLEEIAECGVDYLALGHVHKRSEPAHSGNSVYTYCGCPAGRGFDETGERGAYLVELNGSPRVKFIPLGAREFIDIEARLSTDCAPADVVAAILPSGCERDLIRIRLTGEIEPERLCVADIERALAGQCFYLKISDETKLPRRLWQRAGDDTLAGLVLTLANERSGNESADTELAVRYALAAIDGEEAPLW